MCSVRSQDDSILRMAWEREPLLPACFQPLSSWRPLLVTRFCAALLFLVGT